MLKLAKAQGGGETIFRGGGNAPLNPPRKNPEIYMYRYVHCIYSLRVYVVHVHVHVRTCTYMYIHVYRLSVCFCICVYM